MFCLQRRPPGAGYLTWCLVHSFEHLIGANEICSSMLRLILTLAYALHRAFFDPDLRGGDAARSERGAP